MRDGSLNGSRRRNRSLTKLKIVVFSPMPSASVKTAIAVNAGDLRSWRKANFKSFISLGTKCLNRVDTCGAARRSDLEKIFCNVAAVVTLRLVLVGDVYCRSTEIAGHQRARFLGRFQIFVILRCRNLAEPKIVVLIARLRIDQPNAHQLLRMRKGKAA